MKIPFEIAEEKAFCDSSISSIENLINLSNASYGDGDHNHAVLSRAVKEIKALTYVGMFGLVEGMVRRSCKAFGRKFIEIPPANDLPMASIVARVCPEGVAKAIGTAASDLWKNDQWCSKNANPLMDLDVLSLVPNVKEFWQTANRKGEECFDPGFNGFFQVDSVLAYVNYFGLGDHLHQEKSLYHIIDVDCRESLTRIRSQRNKVAHGERFMKEVGREVSTNILREDFRCVKLFQQAWMDAVHVRGGDLGFYYQIPVE